MTYTQNWHERLTPHWNKMFANLGWCGAPNLLFLEIGAFEGQATVWLLENVLTHESSRIDVVDPFEGNPEFPDAGIDSANLLERFMTNVRPFGSKVGVVSQLPSFRYLCWLNADQSNKYDFIYVDGSHRACDVLADGILAWPLLKTGGVMVFDDFNWVWRVKSTGELLSPGVGIRAFLTVFGGKYKSILSGGDQVGIQKT